MTRTDLPKSKIFVEGVFRSSGRQLLVSLIVLFVSYPFISGCEWGDIAVDVMFSFALLSALLAVGGRRRVLLGGALLLLPVLITHWLPRVTSLEPNAPLMLAFLGLFVAFTIVQLLRFVMDAAHVDEEVLAAGVSIYLLTGLFFTFIYLFIAHVQANPFSFADSTHTGPMTQSDAIYFSFVTLTTVGYGDILPLSKQARMFSNIEAITAFFYAAVLIAYLVALYSTKVNESKNA